MTEAMGFRSPQEELEHLRSKVLEQEALLKGTEHTSREEVIRQTIEQTKQAIPEEIRTSLTVAKDKENIAIERPQNQLDEMISLTKTKGVTHALAVLENLHDWKHEDDYHSYLVSHIREGLPVPAGAEKGPLYRALHMTLYEIVMPEGETVGKQEGNLKSLISSMEQFYAGMIGVSEKETLGKNYFVLEIANSEGSEEFVFYVSVPNEKKSLFEKQILSVFPLAKLVPRDADYNLYVEHGAAKGSIAHLANASAMPLKTFDLFDYDPLNVILNSFSKIPKDGSGAAIQIIFNPQGEMYTKRYLEAIKQIEKGVKAKDAIAERSLGQEFLHGFSDTFFGSSKKKDEEKKVDAEAIERIRRKLESPAVSTNIRLVASAPTETEADQILSEMESSFNQYELPGINRFTWKRTDSASFFRNFSFRLFSDKEVLPLNLREITSILHFHTDNIKGSSQLKKARAAGAPAPLDLPTSGTLLGVNKYQGRETSIYMSAEDRLRHFYTIGQTGTGKSTLLKNMIIQDILRGDGVCMIDPHGVDIQDVLANIPPERHKDVIYFDPASTERPMALNMLEYDQSRPEQKTFVVNELFSIFQKLYGGVPESMGPMFEQYFRNATMLVIEDPATGSTLLDVSRVLSNKEYRALKLSHCKNPVVVQFWREVAEKAGGEGALANIVPYITSKFDVFLANDIMRPIIAQEHSSFDFREIMDNKKILLVNLAKGRLGDVNANLIGLILVGKILMAALSRVDVVHSNDLPPFYLHIDEFQNVTTNSIATILSEARKYKLALSVAHQFIAQLDPGIKDAVFGNVGSIAAFRVGADDAEYLEKQFSPVFTAKDLMNVDNRNAYVKLLVNGRPEKPFSIETLPPPQGDRGHVATLIEMSKQKFGRDRGEVEQEVLAKYAKKEPTPVQAPAPTKI